LSYTRVRQIQEPFYPRESFLSTAKALKPVGFSGKSYLSERVGSKG